MEGIVGISDDIKPKVNPQKDKDEVENRADDPNEVKIHHRDLEIDYPLTRNSELEQKEEDFFKPDSTHDDFQKQSKSEEKVEKPSKKQGNPMTKWVVLLIIILVALLVWQNYSKILEVVGLNKLLNTSNESELESYDSNLQGTDYTSQSSLSADTSSTNANQNQASIAETPATSIDKSKITIKILNGNGISGSAGAVKDQLVQAGFIVDKVANAYNFKYENSIVYFNTGMNVEAELIKTTLSDRQCEVVNDDSVVGNYDIVIVVGKS